MRCYHWTDREFDRFDDAMIGSGGGRHVNSHLGHWFCTTPDAIGAGKVGGRCIEAEVDTTRIFDLSVEKLRRLSMEHPEDLAFFQAFRRQRLREGYTAIRLIERTGLYGQIIALSADAVLSMREFMPEEAPAP